MLWFMQLIDTYYHPHAITIIIANIKRIATIPLAFYCAWGGGGEYMYFIVFCQAFLFK